MIKTENFERIEVQSPDELREWLRKNNEQEESVWLVTHKKSEGDRYVSTGQVLDELLCFGWIDGIRRKLDQRRTMQLISRRRAQHWTATYKTRAARLIEEGRMEAAGRASIDAGKASGLWNFMDDVDQLTVPEDLHTALAARPGALAFFAAINDSSKRNALRYVKLAKTDKTRSKRITRLAELSAQGEKLPQT
jgi:uncharacterized protein YdeI (YjbR/CyaY-like superfamily)